HGQIHIGLSAKPIGSKIFSHVLFLLLCSGKHAARTYHCHEPEKPSPDFRQRLSCYNSFRIVFYEYRGLLYTPSSTSRPMDSTTAARSSGLVTPNHWESVLRTVTLAFPWRISSSTLMGSRYSSFRSPSGTPLRNATKPSSSTWINSG